MVLKLYQDVLKYCILIRWELPRRVQINFSDHYMFWQDERDGVFVY